MYQYKYIYIYELVLSDLGHDITHVCRIYVYIYISQRQIFKTKQVNWL